MKPNKEEYVNLQEIKGNKQNNKNEYTDHLSKRQTQLSENSSSLTMQVKNIKLQKMKGNMHIKETKHLNPLSILKTQFLEENPYEMPIPDVSRDIHLNMPAHYVEGANQEKGVSFGVEALPIRSTCKRICSLIICGASIAIILFICIGVVISQVSQR